MNVSCCWRRRRRRMRSDNALAEVAIAVPNCAERPEQGDNERRRGNKRHSSFGSPGHDATHKYSSSSSCDGDDDDDACPSTVPGFLLSSPCLLDGTTRMAIRSTNGSLGVESDRASTTTLSNLHLSLGVKRTRLGSRLPSRGRCSPSRRRRR